MNKPFPEVSQSGMIDTQIKNFGGEADLSSEETMTSITVSRDVANQLREAGDYVVLIDEAGQMIGAFERSLILPPPYDPADLPPPLSEEELEQRLTEGPLLTTEEVFAKLRVFE